LGDAHAHGAIRPQQIAKALALFEPSHKQDVEVLVAQVPDGRQARTVDVEIDTVGDDAQREIGEVALHERAGRLADRDAAMKMRASWPSWRSRTARRRTWSLTPPGDAKSYGETRPTFMEKPHAARRPASLRPPPKRCHTNRLPDVARRGGLVGGS